MALEILEGNSQGSPTTGVNSFGSFLDDWQKQIIASHPYGTTSLERVAAWMNPEENAIHNQQLMDAVDSHSGSSIQSLAGIKADNQSQGILSTFISELQAAMAEQDKLFERQSQFNAEQAQLDRDFQERMSNTSVQRMVEDIKKAGLNPWLALNGGSLNGASTPSGSSASASAGSSVVPSYFKSLLSFYESLTNKVIDSTMSFTKLFMSLF